LSVPVAPRSSLRRLETVSPPGMTRPRALRLPCLPFQPRLPPGFKNLHSAAAGMTSPHGPPEAAGHGTGAPGSDEDDITCVPRRRCGGGAAAAAWTPRTARPCSRRWGRRPCLAAELASELLRARPREFCTSVYRVARARRGYAVEPSHMYEHPIKWNQTRHEYQCGTNIRSTRSVRHRRGLLLWLRVSPCASHDGTGGVDGLLYLW